MQHYYDSYKKEATAHDKLLQRNDALSFLNQDTNVRMQRRWYGYSKKFVEINTK